MNKQNDSGFTLVELMIVIAIAGILVVIAAPSYRDMLERNRIKQVAEALKSDLQFARTQAIKLSDDITVDKDTGTDGDWCYGFDTSDIDCDCEETDPGDSEYCSLKRITGTSFGLTDLSSTSGDTTFSFRRGTANSGNTCFSTTNYILKVIVNNVGKVEICSDTTASMVGYESCATNCP